MHSSVFLQALTPGQVVERYADLVYRVAFSHVQVKADADDVFQEVFLLYCKKQPAFESEDHRRNWLINVTLKHCKKITFSPWRQRVSPLEEFPALEDAMDDAALAVFTAVQNLPAKYRTPVYLYYYEGFSVDEIAAVTGRRPGTVKSDLFRARETLREQLKGDFFDDK